MAVSTNNRIWRTFTLGCASAPPNRSACQKLRFAVPLSVAFKHNCIPIPLLNLLKYISQEGVTVPDIFRRPGNPTDLRKLIKRLGEGKSVSFTNYNFYTLASVIKRFLLSIPGGVFGVKLEQSLLAVVSIENQLKQYDLINEVIVSLPQSTQHFLALLFGVWFRIVNHIEFHSMSAEAMAKSVTGSIFLNSTGNPSLVNDAIKVMEIMIENYAISSVFGSENLQYFADVTCSGIIVTERFTYHYQYSSSQQSIPRESSLRSFAQHLRKECNSRGLLIEDDDADFESKPLPEHSNTPSPLLPSQARRGMMGCMSVPDVNTHNKFKSHLSLNPNYLDRNISHSLSKFDSVKIKQMARLRKRSEWFLNSKSPPLRSRTSNSNSSRVPSSDYSSLPHQLSTQQRKLTMTSESEGTGSEHHYVNGSSMYGVGGLSVDDTKSEIESVFDDRRSVDTTLADKPLYEEQVYTNDTSSRVGCENHSTNCNAEIVTKHFIKQTTIVPRSNSVIPC